MTPEIEIRQCKECFVKLPLTAYSHYKYSPTTYHPICKECRNQYYRLLRKNKYNAKNWIQIDDSLIRSISTQNSQLVASGLANISIGATFSCVGFVPYTDKRYRVDFSKSRYNMPSMAIFSTDGNMYREYAYSGKESNVPEMLLDILKSEGIRLELSDSYIDYMIKNVYV